MGKVTLKDLWLEYVKKIKLKQLNIYVNNNKTSLNDKNFLKNIWKMI